MNRFITTILIVSSIVGSASAFAPSLPLKNGGMMAARTIDTPASYQPVSLQQQRKSVAQVQTMGLFGLGAPEVGIILVAAAFLLGPDKLAEFGKDAGKIAGELKEVPKEFQAGMAEGEANAKKMKAEEAEVVKVEKDTTTTTTE
jgi:sec-independent protein translocase protein TatA